MVLAHPVGILPLRKLQPAAVALTRLRRVRVHRHSHHSRLHRAQRRVSRTAHEGERRAREEPRRTSSRGAGAAGALLFTAGWSEHIKPWRQRGQAAAEEAAAVGGDGSTCEGGGPAAALTGAATSELCLPTVQGVNEAKVSKSQALCVRGVGSGERKLLVTRPSCAPRFRVSPFYSRATPWCRL